MLILIMAIPIKVISNMLQDKLQVLMRIYNVSLQVCLGLASLLEAHSLSVQVSPMEEDTEKATTVTDHFTQLNHVQRSNRQIVFKKHRMSLLLCLVLLYHNNNFVPTYSNLLFPPCQVLQEMATNPHSFGTSTLFYSSSLKSKE